MTPTVALVGSDPRLEELLRACGARVRTISLGEFSALSDPAAKVPEVVVLDLRQHHEVPPAVAIVTRQHGTMGVVLVASSLEPALILSAMRAGVNECVTEPLTKGDLELALSRVLSRTPARVAGDVFAFVGAKGGVGTTTLAVNVATLLARAARAGGRPDADGKARSPVLVIDLHLACGDATVYLGVEPRFSIADAIQNLHRLDDAYMRGLIISSKAGPDVLASSDQPVLTPIDPASIRSLIDIAVGLYRYVVVDVPCADLALLHALSPASKIVVVTTQELAAVRSASRLAAVLRRRPGGSQMKLVVNRYALGSQIAIDDVERVTGLPAKHLIPSAYRVALEALNAGRPLVLENHSKLASSVAGLAKALSGLSAEPSLPPRETGLFGRFLPRRG